MDQNLTHRIRERAYELWAANGYRDGESERHWLTAEREILSVAAADIAFAPPVAKKAPRSSARGLKKAARLAG